LKIIAVLIIDSKIADGAILNKLLSDKDIIYNLSMYWMLVLLPNGVDFLNETGEKQYITSVVDPLLKKR
jgi:hypothetical protein